MLVASLQGSLPGPSPAHLPPAQQQPPASRGAHFLAQLEPNTNSVLLSASFSKFTSTSTWNNSSHCFCHYSGQIFSLPPCSTFGNHSLSVLPLLTPSQSSCYRKRSSEMWPLSWRGCLLWQPASNTHLQHQTGKASKVILHWHYRSCGEDTIASLSLDEALHQHLLYAEWDAVQLSLVTSPISIAWTLIWERRPKITMQLVIISEWAWSRQYIAERYNSLVIWVVRMTLTIWKDGLKKKKKKFYVIIVDYEFMNYHKVYFWSSFSVHIDTFSACAEMDAPLSFQIQMEAINLWLTEYVFHIHNLCMKKVIVLKEKDITRISHSSRVMG